MARTESSAALSGNTESCSRTEYAALLSFDEVSPHKDPYRKNIFKHFQTYPLVVRQAPLAADLIAAWRCEQESPESCGRDQVGC